ncbi:MAG: LamG domain-containing protein [Nitrospirae bacterium]|nr:LamG domain-containing protein [Nitrospirota bacterium]
MCYKFEDNYNDSSGNNNNGTGAGGISFVTGKSGKAINLDGTSGYVKLPDTSGLNFGNGVGYTFTAWIKTSDSNGQVLSFRDQNNGTPVINLTVGYNGAASGNGQFMPLVRHNNGGIAYFTSGTAINDNQWHLVALVFDPTLGKIIAYVDGNKTEVSHVYSSGGVTTTGLRNIGRDGRWANDGLGGTSYIAGLIDEIRIFNRALSQTEIGTVMTESGGGGNSDVKVWHYDISNNLSYKEDGGSCKIVNIGSSFTVKSGSSYTIYKATDCASWELKAVKSYDDFKTADSNGDLNVKITNVNSPTIQDLNIGTGSDVKAWHYDTSSNLSYKENGGSCQAVSIGASFTAKAGNSYTIYKATDCAGWEIKAVKPYNDFKAADSNGDLNVKVTNVNSANIQDLVIGTGNDVKVWHYDNSTSNFGVKENGGSCQGIYGASSSFYVKQGNSYAIYSGPSCAAWDLKCVKPYSDFKSADVNNNLNVKMTNVNSCNLADY